MILPALSSLRGTSPAQEHNFSEEMKSVCGVAAILSLSASVALMAVYLGSFSPSWNLLADLLMSFAIGSAAAAVLQKRKTE